MNNFSKKLLSVLIAAGTMASAIPAFASAIPEDVAGTRYEEPVQVLSALQIMIGDENGLFRLDDTIIRSEVAKMAVHAMGLEDAAEAAKGTSRFADVGTDHWANGYINIATQQGLVEGDENGNFRPNDSITYEEAMAIMIRATGYDVSARDKGTWPLGYISVGTSIGLAKNVSAQVGQPISRGNVAFLTENALDAKMMEQTGYGSNIKYEVTDKTLLKDKLDVTKGEGQIEAVENTSISGSAALGKGQIRIDGNVYGTAYNMNNLLGYNVTYYAKEYADGRNEVILAMPVENKNNELVVTADLFSKLTTKNSNTAIEYFKDDNTSKVSTAEISSDAVLIYNGKYESMDAELLNMENKAGKIAMLDTDRDGKYDIVFVTVYENMVVEAVTSSNKVVDKYSSKTLKLDETVDFRITKGLEEISVSDLKEFDVLSIAASRDNTLFDINVTNTNVEGKVSATSTEGVYIDGKLYKVANNYTDELSIGTEGTFYFDIEGKIAAVDTASTLSTNYAYLMRAYTTVGTEVSNFKMFTKAGETVTIEASDKVRVNGKNGVKAADAVKAINDESGETPMQLVTYSVNSEGKVNAIDMAQDNSATGAVDIKNFTKNYTLNNAEYSAALSKLGNVRIDANTVIFDIPSDSEDSTEYSIQSKDVFEDEQKYDAVVYDMTENYTAKAIVLTNAAIKATADAPAAIVKNISSAVNNNEEETDLITVLVNGEEKDIYAKDETVLVKGENKKLENGDVIQYKTNANGEIVSIRVLFDISAKDTEAVNEPMENLKTVYGKVTKKFANSVNVTVNDGSIVNYELPEDVNVYSVDTTKTKNNIVAAEAGDIQNFDADENNRVFIKLYKDIVTEVVIIK